MPTQKSASARLREEARWWSEISILVADTGRVWWRLLPQVVGLYLLGWLGSHLVLSASVIAGDLSAWLSLILFSFNFVVLLTSTVLILRLVEREIGIQDLIPAEEAAGDGRETSVSRLLAVTLLPFLGMYAAFGQVAEAANRLVVQQTFRYGVITDAQTVMGLLNSMATNHLPWLLALIVGIYLLRRLIDLGHQRTGRAALAMLAILVESFFLLLLLMGGVRVFQYFAIWLADRKLASWWDAAGAAISGFFARFAIDLPEVVDRVWAFFVAQIWPVFWEVISQPIIWLAVAALVFGSRVLSIAELWRQGQAITQVVPGMTRFARYSDRLAARRSGPAPRGVLLAVGQVRQAFFGDIDDKYLPTIHSVRLVLRAGVGFLGSYVLVYSVTVIGENYAGRLVEDLLGGRPAQFWISWGPVLTLVQKLPFETLRLCLLAVAFRRCLELFAQRAGQESRGRVPLAADPHPEQASA